MINHPWWIIGLSSRFFPVASEVRALRSDLIGSGTSLEAVVSLDRIWFHTPCAELLPTANPQTYKKSALQTRDSLHQEIALAPASGQIAINGLAVISI